jgi:hypothetical protein
MDGWMDRWIGAGAYLRRGGQIMPNGVSKEVAG